MSRSRMTALLSATALALTVAASAGAAQLPIAAPGAAPPSIGAADPDVFDQAPVDLFRLQSDTAHLPKTGWHAVQDALEEYHIDAEPKLLVDGPARIVVDLPQGPRLEALRTAFTDYGPEWKSWSGTLRHAGTTNEGTGYAYFGYHGERITGVIHFEGARFRITGGIGEPQRLVRQSDELVDSAACGLHDLGDASTLSAGEATNGAEVPSFLQKTATRIDVMALYPKAFFVSPTTQIYLYDDIEDSIAQANTIFTNSKINAYYNLVHSGPIIGTQPSAQGPQGGLDLLNAQGSEISTLRTAYGADMVTMFVPYWWTAAPAGQGTPCGVANMPVRNGSNALDTYAGQGGLLGTSFGERAYSSQRHDCGFGDFTVGHEMGHNFGMWHSAGNPTGATKLATDALSFYITGAGKNTAMGCQNAGGSAGTAAVCDRVAHFSSDDVTATYMGYGTGNGSRDNAQMAIDRVGTYAGFEPQKTISNPVASFSVDACPGRLCRFDASASTGSPTEYFWDFGDGVTVTTNNPVTYHFYGGSGTSYWVHLVVTKSNDQRDLGIDLVSVP